jgi:hypothetical protein
MLRGLIPGKWEAAFTGAPIWRFNMRDNDGFKEFDCDTCHVHVYTWPNDDRTKCAVCLWISNLKDITPEQEAEIRMITATPILEKNDD